MCSGTNRIASIMKCLDIGTLGIPHCTKCSWRIGCIRQLTGGNATSISSLRQFRPFFFCASLHPQEVSTGSRSILSICYWTSKFHPLCRRHIFGSLPTNRQATHLCNTYFTGILQGMPVMIDHFPASFIQRQLDDIE
jgi:hypothetical protein